MAKSRSSRTPARRQSQPARQQQRANTAPSPLGIIAQRTEEWQAPLPRPQDLAHYGTIDPSFPERIVRMAERVIELGEEQTRHRIKMEDRITKAWNRRAGWGLVLGFVLAIAVLGGSGWLVYNGHEVPGTIFGTIDLVSLVSVFVIGRVADRRREDS